MKYSSEFLFVCRHWIAVLEFLRKSQPRAVWLTLVVIFYVVDFVRRNVHASVNIEINHHL